MTDIMSRSARSSLMARIRPKNTKLETVVFAAVRRKGLKFCRHKEVLPRCTPDLVFPAERVAVLVHGDFWHGWQFGRWRAKLAPFWRIKIETNRARDKRNERSLRRAGWRVVRIWEHEIERDLDAALLKIAAAVCQG